MSKYRVISADEKEIRIKKRYVGEAVLSLDEAKMRIMRLPDHIDKISCHDGPEKYFSHGNVVVSIAPKDDEKTIVGTAFDFDPHQFYLRFENQFSKDYHIELGKVMSMDMKLAELGYSKEKGRIYTVDYASKKDKVEYIVGQLIPLLASKPFMSEEFLKKLM